MDILAHRGYWLDPSEKNTSEAFERAFASGFGVETDIRDYRGELVISHDPPVADCMKAADFLSLYTASGCRSTLALNIKSDGLQQLVAEQLALFQTKDYFVFDMSVPDLIQSVKAGLECFSRISDLEKTDQLSAQVSGLWLDGFESNWFGEREIVDLQQRYRKIAIVSPELQGRQHLAVWEELKKVEDQESLLLCTDLPQQAREFFE